jgi:hypothetical protein
MNCSACKLPLINAITRIGHDQEENEGIGNYPEDVYHKKMTVVVE